MYFKYILVWSLLKNGLFVVLSKITSTRIFSQKHHLFYILKKVNYWHEWNQTYYTINLMFVNDSIKCSKIKKFSLLQIYLLRIFVFLLYPRFLGQEIWQYWICVYEWYIIIIKYERVFISLSLYTLCTAKTYCRISFSSRALYPNIVSGRNNSVS